MREAQHIALLLIFGGVLCIVSAWCNWTPFLQHRKARLIVAILGRDGARVFYFIFGVMLVLGGLGFAVGAIPATRGDPMRAATAFDAANDHALPRHEVNPMHDAARRIEGDMIPLESLDGSQGPPTPVSVHATNHLQRSSGVEATNTRSASEITQARQPRLPADPFQSVSSGRRELVRQDHIADARLDEAVERAFSDSSRKSFGQRPQGALTEELGGDGGGQFWIDGGGKPIVGFVCSLRNWGGQDVIRTLVPLYDSRDVWQSRATIAKDGYAVGGLIIDAETYVNAFQVVFMRLDGDRLDPADSYTSDWVGHPTGRTQRKLAGSGKKVLGVHGHKGLILDSVGLIVEGP